MRIIRVLAGLAIAGVIVCAPVVAHATTITPEAKDCISKLQNGGAVSDCVTAPNPILPATDEIVWGGASFIILFAVMAKYAFPAVKKGMDARTDKIRGDLDGAEQAKTEATQILQQYQQQLADAKSEANRVIEAARQTAEQMRKEMIERAEKEAADLRERNQTEINASKDRMMVDLRSEVGDLAIELAEKVVEHNIDKKANDALIENYIKQVGASK